MKKNISKATMFSVLILVLLLPGCSANIDNSEEMWEMHRTIRAEGFEVMTMNLYGDEIGMVQIIRSGEDSTWIMFWITRDRYSRIVGISFYQYDIGSRFGYPDYVYVSPDHPGLADGWNPCIGAEAQASYEAFISNFAYSEAELIEFARWWIGEFP